MTLYQSEDALIVEVDLPLVRKEDIHIRLLAKSVEIEATMYRCMRFERWGTVQRSCEFSSFHRVIPLPTAVMAEDVKATFQKGILRIELQKKQDEEYLIPVK